ncbi:MAG: type II toxin-antitoxin system RelE/ParE family toxin [Nitrospira sp.]|nr:MAG: type II toxin-antitoxin system RelE/ParE family toxin [Nitrospira sp.]
MRRIVWTRRAIEDTQAIKTFIAQDSPRSANLVVERLIAAIEHLPTFPESGRIVPEIQEPAVREIIRPPYRIVYRVRQEEIHIITVHHAARLLRLES